MKLFSYLCTASLLATWLSAPAQAQETMQVIYSEISTDATSSVPGFPGMPIDAIDRGHASSNGQHWIITLFVNTGSGADDEMVIVDGVVVAQEGEAAPYLPAGRTHQVFDQGVHILNSGAFAFGGDFSGAIADDDFIARGDGLGNITLVARQGDPIPGAPSGWLFGNLDSSVITDAGVGFETDAVLGGPAPGMDNLMMLHNGILLQSGVDAPSGQAMGATETWENFDYQRYFVTTDGAHYMVRGDLTGSTLGDNVVVVDGVVVAQELQPLPGGVPTDLVDNSTTGVTGIHMSENGHWMARGQFDSSLDGWVLFDGNLVAREGNPIFAGSLEIFDSTFFAVACNNRGDYAIIGSSDAPVDTDTVVVFRNERVVLREGDPVDLDGNGLFDDDVFLSSFGSDDMTLTDDYKLFLTGTLENGTGASLGDFFGMVQLDAPEIGVAFCDPADLNSTGMPGKLTGFLNAPGGSTLHLEATQGPDTQFGYFLIGTASTEPGLAISQGHLCLDTLGGNSFGRYNVFGSTLNSVGQFDAAGVLQNQVGTSSVGSGFDVPLNVPIPGFGNIAAGETWHFQLWFRENGGASNFSNGLSVTF